MHASLGIAALLLISLVLGVVRDLLIAYELGAGGMADILFMALVLPVFFENILGVALRDAVIPYLQKLRSGSVATLADAVQRLYVGALGFGTAIALLIGVGASSWLALLAPGWSASQVETGVPSFAVGAALIAVQTVLYCQTAFMNIDGRFVLPMWRTVLFNIGGISALLVFARNSMAIVAGMFIGQLILMFVLHFQVRHLWKRTKSVTKEAMPGFIWSFMPVLVATALLQLNVIAERLFASRMDEGSITLLSLSFRIATITLTLYTFSILAIIYTAIASRVAEGYSDAVVALVRQGLGFTLLFLVPAAVFLAMYPGPVIAFVFERGAFTTADSIAGTPILTAYACGLPAMGLALFGGRLLLAQHQMRAFLLTAAIATVVTIGLDALLYKGYGAVGLAVAYSVGCWIQVLISGWLLVRGGFSGGLSYKSMLRWTAAAAAVVSFFAALPRPDGLAELVIYAFFVLIAHVAIVTALGERDWLSRGFWVLHGPLQDKAS